MLPKIGTVEAQDMKFGNVYLHNECEGVSGEMVVEGEGTAQQHMRDLTLDMWKRVGRNKIIFHVCRVYVCCKIYTEPKTNNINLLRFMTVLVNQIKDLKSTPIFKKSNYQI